MARTLPASACKCREKGAGSLELRRVAGSCASLLPRRPCEPPRHPRWRPAPRRSRWRPPACRSAARRAPRRQRRKPCGGGPAPRRTAAGRRGARDTRAAYPQLCPAPPLPCTARPALQARLLPHLPRPEEALAVKDLGEAGGRGLGRGQRLRAGAGGAEGRAATARAQAPRPLPPAAPQPPPCPHHHGVGQPLRPLEPRVRHHAAGQHAPVPARKGL
jgi:hypothetical protein